MWFTKSVIRINRKTKTKSPLNIKSKPKLLIPIIRIFIKFTGKFERLIPLKETSSTTLAWAFAYLINHPWVIEKVHAELDDVIGAGNSRFITIADRPMLPYMNALINVSFWVKQFLMIFFTQIMQIIQNRKIWIRHLTYGTSSYRMWFRGVFCLVFWGSQAHSDVEAHFLGRIKMGIWLGKFTILLYVNKHSGGSQRHSIRIWSALVHHIFWVG